MHPFPKPAVLPMPPWQPPAGLRQGAERRPRTQRPPARGHVRPALPLAVSRVRRVAVQAGRTKQQAGRRGRRGRRGHPPVPREQGDPALTPRPDASAGGGGGAAWCWARPCAHATCSAAAAAGATAGRSCGAAAAAASGAAAAAAAPSIRRVGGRCLRGTLFRNGPWSVPSLGYEPLGWLSAAHCSASLKALAGRVEPLRGPRCPD